MASAGQLSGLPPSALQKSQTGPFWDREMLLPAVFLLFAVVLQADLSSGSGLSAEDQKEILDKHNDLRRNVEPTASNMLKMVWDDKVAASAEKWAAQCKLSISPNAQRIINGIMCGENVFMASYPSRWSNVIQTWYNSVSNFKYGVGAIDSKKSISGYTQIVWYKSYKLGCARAQCPNQKYSYFFVCQYCPAGNIVGQMATPYKKGPSCGDCPKNCDNKLCTNPCTHEDIYSNCPQMLQFVSCKETMMIEKCPATCNCKTEIK